MLHKTFNNGTHSSWELSKLWTDNSIQIYTGNKLSSLDLLLLVVRWEWQLETWKPSPWQYNIIKEYYYNIPSKVWTVMFCYGPTSIMWDEHASTGKCLWHQYPTLLFKWEVIMCVAVWFKNVIYFKGKAFDTPYMVKVLS